MDNQSSPWSLSHKRNISAALGNVIEWYDFCLYGYFAPLLAQAFFPNDDKYVSLLYVFLTFASGYLMRPIGGIVFGHLGDSLGRGRALYYSVCLIALPTFFIGLLPDYHRLGVLSPILLIIIRLLQGLSAGGQYSGSLVYLREHNHSRLGARALSMAYLGSLSGYLLASCIGAISTYYLNDQLAWRIPFLFTVILIFALKCCYTKEDEQISKTTPIFSKTPIMILFSKHKLITLKSTILASIGSIFYSSFFIFLITYLNVFVGLNMSSVLWINTICLISSGFSIVYFASMADHFGRRIVLLLSLLSIFLLIYPAFALFASGMFLSSLLGTWLLTTANTAFMAACPAVFVELFPRKVRYTGCAFSYNVGAGIVGGFVPFVLTLIMHHDRGLMLSSLMLAAGLAILFVYFAIQETLSSRSTNSC